MTGLKQEEGSSGSVHMPLFRGLGKSSSFLPSAAIMNDGTGSPAAAEQRKNDMIKEKCSITEELWRREETRECRCLWVLLDN